MASSDMKGIKRRIRSIESTRQITKAMELVASSKLKKAKEKADMAKPFFKTLYEVMCEIVSYDNAFESVYMKKRDGKISLFVIIGGDRGLAGGYNSNLLKLFEKRCEELEKDSKIVVLPIGKKAVDYCVKHNLKIMKSYENIAESLTIYGAEEIASNVISVYKNKNIKRVELFYTEIISPLNQEARRIPLIPLEIKVAKGYRGLVNYDPSPEEVFDMITPKYISGILYGAVLESFAAEQAARRMAMENATDNANDMISELSVKYNRARQSAITQEITEIVGGAGT